jgi:predicted SAM-dependent methyltransferase
MKRSLFKARAGIRLDVGCGSQKQSGYVGMDIRKIPGVDIVHDAQKFPYPIPSNCCHTVLLSHLWEHIEPKYRIDLVNEIWRIMQPDGQLLISCPYYASFGACQDPTHYTCPNEATFTYFDPKHPMYKIYEPKPWRLTRNNYVMSGNMEIILEAVK